jgi:hypothetical protein
VRPSTSRRRRHTVTAISKRRPRLVDESELLGAEIGAAGYDKLDQSQLTIFIHADDDVLAPERRRARLR